MPGGTIARCPNRECGRLLIYGQTCTCGQVTHLPFPFFRKGHREWVARYQYGHRR